MPVVASNQAMMSEIDRARTMPRMTPMTIPMTIPVAIRRAATHRPRGPRGSRVGAPPDSCRRPPVPPPGAGGCCSWRPSQSRKHRQNARPSPTSSRSDSTTSPGDTLPRSSTSMAMDPASTWPHGFVRSSGSSIFCCSVTSLSASCLRSPACFFSPARSCISRGSCARLKSRCFLIVG